MKGLDNKGFSDFWVGPVTQTVTQSRPKRAVSSAVEHPVYTGTVGGSIPSPPTIALARLPDAQSIAKIFRTCGTDREWPNRMGGLPNGPRR